ncbi:MAG TPA: D-alanine--D-alanine ligase [Bacteroidales bacterium]|nr:D-alanine--D-alanine ligase [Bacteroidales bacterium]
MAKNIAVVAGGNSSEYVISVQSGAMLAEEVSKAGYNMFLVKLKGAEWKAKLPDGRLVDVDKNDFSISIDAQKVKFDCALIAIHGTPGEDGMLQGYFDCLQVPYTSCGVLASALTFDKYACKLFLNNFGINTAKGILISKNEKWDVPHITSVVGFPCIVKPNASGSSFGVTKVDEENQLLGAIEHALTESNEVLIEQFISGTEVTNGVYVIDKEELVFPVTEIVSKTSFFDFEAKYNAALSEEITPARISDEITRKVQQTSLKIYKALNCKGIVRIDYIINDGAPYFLEVNTVPGMSPNSIIPKQIKTMGLTVAEVYKKIIDSICR